MSHFDTSYRTAAVDDIQVFYREAGNPEAPTLLLLHGFPTSSHMFRNLIPALSDKFHIIAPDLPGFGQTQVPGDTEFDFTFDNLAHVIEGFTQALNLKQYALYMFDYGAPVGFRLAAKNPEKVTALISQNGNAYSEGLTEGWDPIKAYWADKSQENRDALRGFLSLDTTRFQYTQGVPENLLERISPDAIHHDQAILDRDQEIQLDLFGDYASNVALYPEWQNYLRTQQPPFIALWGQNDPFFAVEGAKAFSRDLPNAEIHLFDTGHFALETHGDEIAEKIVDFLTRVTSQQIAA